MRDNVSSQGDVPPSSRTGLASFRAFCRRPAAVVGRGGRNVGGGAYAVPRLGDEPCAAEFAGVEGAAAFAEHMLRVHGVRGLRPAVNRRPIRAPRAPRTKAEVERRLGRVAEKLAAGGYTVDVALEAGVRLRQRAGDVESV